MSTDFGHSSRMYVGPLQQQKIIIYEDDEGFFIIVKRIDGQSSCNYPCNPCSHLPTCHFCSPSLHATHISATRHKSLARNLPPMLSGMTQLQPHHHAMLQSTQPMWSSSILPIKCHNKEHARRVGKIGKDRWEVCDQKKGGEDSIFFKRKETSRERREIRKKRKKKREREREREK